MPDPRDWYLTTSERDNPNTLLDAPHPGDQAWSEGNSVRPLVHGAVYFAELYEAIEATRPGDLVFFTDWQGNADEQLTDDPDTKVVDVLARADARDVDVRGLIWRSHTDKIGFTSEENRTLGEQLQQRGAEVLLDMRVRTGGAHHQKFVVIRHKDDPSRDIAFVGGIDLCHNRRDDATHGGDNCSTPMASEYGEHPPWHDIQVAIQGPAVHDVETVFRERWNDPTPLSRLPMRWVPDRLTGMDISPDKLPDQKPPPPAAGELTLQLLRTYPNLRHGRDYPFARGGERSIAKGYSKALRRAERLIYVEDQYFWGHDVAGAFEQALEDNQRLHVMVVMPRVPDLDGPASRVPQMLGRTRCLERLSAIAPGRVAAYSIENHQATPVYVHAKTCIIDDTWASVGSDNFNRRSWTHDSELTAAVLDETYARTLRLRLNAEHLDRLQPDVIDALGSPNPPEVDLRAELSDCLTAEGVFAAYAESARRLEEWHQGGRQGERPPGRLRPLPLPSLGRLARSWAKWPLEMVHDPDGRPGPLRGKHARY